MRPSLTIVRLFVLVASCHWLAAADAALQVRHDHDPWGACTGQLSFSEQGIRFDSVDESHIREWGWTDIQTVDRLSAARFSILSYKDQKWLLGRDQPWDFEVLDPQSKGLTDEAFATVLLHLPRPVVDRLPREIRAVYEVPVKHLHTFGGCEGILRFSPEWIVYDTERARDARSWRRSSEVVNVWSTGRFDLEVEVYEKEAGDLLRTRRYHFQLKEPLDEKYYTEMRRGFIPAR